MSPNQSSPWRIFVDTGGTFTDALAVDPAGRLHRAKVLSSSVLRACVAAVEAGRWRLEQHWGACDHLVRGWEVRRSQDGATIGRVTAWHAERSELAVEGGEVAAGTLIDAVCPDDAPVLAARVLTRTPGDQPLPPMVMRLATTRGTNALLTGDFPRPTLFITAGLEDLLEIGTQQRPDACLFSLDTRRPPPPVGQVIGVDERVGADGVVVRPLDVERLLASLQTAATVPRGAAAVALLHADQYPEHERLVAAAVKQCGFDPVVCSHRVSPHVKLLPRAMTTVVEAALAPVVSAYIRRLERGIGPQSRLEIMTSAGGLVPGSRFAAKDSLLSGPAGGVVGAAAAAELAGSHEAFAFDMGGTSTDVSRWSAAGGLEHASEHTAGTVTLVSPAVRVHTVAAGGGSVCGFDGAALTVGPASAGAAPGPACYGRGGPMTLTDVQVLSGRMYVADFGVPLDLKAAERACDDLLQSIQGSTGATDSRAAVLDGLLAIAAERIAAAIRIVASMRGHDPACADLLAFGGAGGQIACLVAERLGMPRVLVPRDAGLLSARGLIDAEFQTIAQRQVLKPLHEAAATLPTLVDEMRAEADRELASHAGVADLSRLRVYSRLSLALRWEGQETPVEIDDESLSEVAIRRAFDQAYRRQYGYVASRPAAALELVWLRLVARAQSSNDAPGQDSATSTTYGGHTRGHRTQPMRSRGRESLAPVIARDDLRPGETLAGPALIVEPHCTTVVESGWQLAVLSEGTLALTPSDRQTVDRTHADTALDAATVELYTSRLESAARAMGAALQRTSVSVNVKERLDYSCAVLDAEGRLVACAPHVPVHLGSLGVCVREVRARISIGRGDVIVTNHPACGGSHLPDVTVIAAAFADGSDTPIGYVAARAHHAEIGGIRPGSMPPDARCLADEGVVIAPIHAVRGGVEQLNAVAAVLSDGSRSIASRNVATNLEDLRAAIAACRSGVAELDSLAAGPDGTALLTRMMEALQARSARAASEVIAGLGTVDLALRDELDDGSPLCVRVQSQGETLTFDFTGSAGVHPGNLNATPAIVRSFLVYVMRVLVGRDLPLNEGLMRPVQVILPPGMFNPPFDPAADPRTQPAVVGGNVELSQRLVNLLIRGLGLSAESQGTMNNLIFGDATRSYYETIGGGAGAGPGFDGASAAHTHMTNTRITDPEILERRYPVRLERFAVRRGSGGVGTYRGGDGIERMIRFLEPMRVSVLTQRRVHGPPGLAGGADGAAGMQWIERSDGSKEMLRSSDGADVGPGDAIVMLTPGGGGYGQP